jgi:lipid II:glycine glycyltransferase (peptidoglycan interpeptide bridge formation enzyme)
LELIRLNERDRDYWDQEIAGFDKVHPLNAFGWGKVRSIDGWIPRYYLTRDGGLVTGMMMVLQKRIPFIPLSIMYAPKGPVWKPANSDETLKTLLSGVRDDARKCRAIFLRIDPNVPDSLFTGDGDPFLSEGFVHLDHRWTFWNSPRDVYRIDLAKAANEEELFNTIDKDARRSVRKAANEGVSIRAAESPDELQKFYEIFSGFSVGKGFMCRAYEYQEALWREFIERGNGRLFLAVYQGEIIGGLICLLFGDKCLAMHMGTPYAYHRLQTYYAYVWESVRWAKERGCVWYSFRGVGTTPTQESFKRKFRPQVVALTGYYDLPLIPLLYKLFNICEFEILPRVWHTLMKIRKIYKRLVSPVATAGAAKSE